MTPAPGVSFERFCLMRGPEAKFQKARHQGGSDIRNLPKRSGIELELKLMQSQMAQKLMLRGEVGARELRVQLFYRPTLTAASIGAVVSNKQKH